MKKISVITFVLISGGMISFTMPAAWSATGHTSRISGPFQSPMEVTGKCLSCHAEAATEVMKTTHWTWASEQIIPGKGKVIRGKKNAINNFCISINGNWSRCTSCHVGYGWKDADFDFSDPSRVDCLICHDTTGTYKKYPTGAGMPYGYVKKKTDKVVDLVMVARNVGKPSRNNCIACHGFGGGGNNVKHGDIDSSMILSTRQHDVHMGSNGANFTCQRCHKTQDHVITGNAMVVSPGGKDHIGCANGDCHETDPHFESLLNDHTRRVACQTCHIPAFAKEIPTKMEWDWSQAGNDHIESPTDKHGKKTYAKKKGSFVWGKNVTPVYKWYNGTAGAYLPGDKIDPTKVTRLNWPIGDRSDEKARIYPFKAHRGKQIYDTENYYLITPKLFGSETDPVAYWVNYDWQKAAKAGMRISGLPYSGKYGFAPTIMFWRINHMVVPAAKALDCLDCHGDNGRLDWKALGYEADPMRMKLAMSY